MKARLGMGPDSPGQLCPEEWQRGILLVSEWLSKSGREYI